MDKIKQKRSTVRALTTKLVSKTETLISSENPTLVELDELSAELMLKEAELKEIDSQIQDAIIDVKEIENEVIKCDEYMTSIIRSKCRIKNAIEKIKISDSSIVSSSIVSEPKVIINRKMYDAPYIKLPLLSIEKFAGDPSDFQRFWDQFKSAVHNNLDLSSVEKFNYLRSFLVGSAADAIKGFSLTNDNYNSAVDILKERFGTKTVVINSHLTKLLNLTPVKKSTDILSLRKLFDTCQTEIRNLASLGLKSENFEALLSPIIIKNLPSEIVLEITKKCGSDEWKVEEILDLLKAEIVSREKASLLIAQSECNPPSVIRNRESEVGKQNRKSLPSPYTAANLFNESCGRRERCILCESEKHSLSDCGEFIKKQLNEKREFLKKRGCCFICLRKGHMANKCRRYVKCTECSKRHFGAMCPEKKSDSSVENESTSLSNKTCKQEVFMQTLTVRLQNKNKEILIRGLIDSGSEKSYLTKQAIKRIGYLPIGHEKLNHSLFGGVQETHDHSKYRVFLSSLDNTYRCNFEVYDQETICAKVPKIRNGPWIKNAQKYGIKFCDFNENKGLKDEINLLIGADICGKLFTGKLRSVSQHLTAMETRLGWTVMGKTGEPDTGNSTNVVLSLHVAEAKITDLWRLDTLGILDPGERGTREELDKDTEEHFNRSIKVVEQGRYEVSLPWIEGHPPLPSCRSIAERRLKNCVESLKRCGKLEAYEAVFEEWQREGIIEEVMPYHETKPEYFLPHRAVVKENSTTRIRPVFDGSAREKGYPSINDCLGKGPNLVELIPSVINRFRFGKIGVISDIKKAFLQIQLSENDRPYLRFLWWKDGDPNNLKIFQHRRVVFGLTCSPYLLGATLQYHLKRVPETMKETADKLLESFYIDNCVTSVDNIEQLEKFIFESKQILSTAMFDLRGWEHNYPIKTNLTSEKQNVPVLGLTWELGNDVLSIDVQEPPDNNETVTKRMILSEAHKVFDPVGFSCPVTLYPKLLLQECWQKKVTWDSELPPSIAKKFEKWRKQLCILKEIFVPRCLIDDPDNVGNLSLHVFSDASKVAYATCIFLRSENENSTSCQLVQARSRVTPLKSITIPRLELLACTIGIRLTETVKNDLKLDNIPTTYWTDSSNALCWIKNCENWAPFVFNRVQEIRSKSNPENWRHVPGSLNPADLPSRGCTTKFLEESRWWEGPPWLKEHEDFWPKDKISPDPDIIESERRKSIITSVNISKDPFDLYEGGFSYSKMIKITAWVYRFFRNTKIKPNERNLENLNREEMDNAEYIVLKYAQRRLLDEKKPCYTSLQKYKDKHGLIRVRTRIALRDDQPEFRYPIVLPWNHNITRQLILEKHKEVLHAGIQIVMSVVREKFWIPRCRRTVRQVVKTCATCKRFLAQPAEVIPALLPEERVREAAVFEIVGTDLCGPLFLKDSSKCWVVIFTCAVFRAIHIELVTSLSTDQFLLALRRFIARRGRPAVIFSDNGTNLRKANSELKSIDFEKLQRFADVKQIHWKFNPPSAPWWGGFFERMIGMLKTILRRILGKANLNYEELYTVLCDAESVINSRPLTYLSDDDDLLPLTPAMFLQEIKDSRVPDIDLIDATKMKKRFAYRQKIRQDLRKRFRNEYLGQLKNFANTKQKTDIRTGDIVLIGDDNCKRINWPLGKILELYPGRDGEVRVAKVKTQSGSLVRPLKRIYSLELRDNISVPILVDKPPVPLVESSSSDPVADDAPVPEPQRVSPDLVPEPQRVSGPVPSDEPSAVADPVHHDHSSRGDLAVHRTPRTLLDDAVRHTRAGRPLVKPDRLDL